MNIDFQTWLAIFAALAAVAIAVVAIVLKRRNDRLRLMLAELNAGPPQHSSEPPPAEAVPAAQPSAPEPPAVESAIVEAPVVEAAVVEPAVEPPAQAVVPEPPVVEPAAAEQEAAPEIAVAIPTPSTQDSEVRERNLAIRRAQERAVEFASRQGRRRHPGPAPESLPRLDDMNPKEALSEWLNKRAAARAARKTMPAPEPPPIAEPATVAAPAPEPAGAIAEPSPAEPSRDREEAVAEPAAVAEPVSIAEPAVIAEPAAIAEPVSIAEPAPVAEPVAIAEPAAIAEPSPIAEEAVAQPAAEEPKQPEVFIDESLWESIVSQSQALKRPNLRFELIQGASLPVGLQDEAVLRRLLESNKPFHGLAVAVGVSLTGGGALSQDLMLHIEQLVRSLLEENDFACQTGDDEFVLLCPGKHSAEALRRLSAISERIWDFQLRGAGNFSVLFSTGDAQVAGEPLREAFAAASARLRQTSRVRKTMSVAPRKSVSAAV